MSDTTNFITAYVGSYGDRRFKQWAKLVTAVDITKTNGYAFEGQFLTLNRKHRLPVGAVVLSFGRFGSMKRNSPAVKVEIVRNNGLEVVFERKQLDESWTLDVVHDIAAMLQKEAGD